MVPFAFAITTSTTCTSCSVSIQIWVAEETGGLCRPCAAGALKCAECGKPMMRQPFITDAEHVCMICLKKKPSTTEEVEYNGVMMENGWPEKIIAAQKIKTLVIYGKRRSRIRYGSEKNRQQDFALSCGDCAVILGQLHVPLCDQEQCPKCLGQLLSCGCVDNT
jgi:hypothetical protein